LEGGEGLHGFDRVLTWIENSLAALALGGATVIAIAGVIMRYVFGDGIFWSEEAVIFLVILSTFIGAVITLRHNEHVNVDIMPSLLGERGKWVFAMLGTLLLVIYCGVIGAYAWILIFEPAASNTITPSLKLPLWVVELSLPIGLTMMFMRSMEVLYRTARGQVAFPEAEENEFAEDTPEGALSTTGEADSRDPDADDRDERSDR
ncbi:MAG: TRAP transporter small permease, partial [Rubrobacteraceae bacterium]